MEFFKWHIQIIIGSSIALVLTSILLFVAQFQTLIPCVGASVFGRTLLLLIGLGWILTLASWFVWYQLIQRLQSRVNHLRDNHHRLVAENQQLIAAMTASQQSEADLRQQNQQLSQSFQQLQAQQTQLIQTEKMASLGQLVAGIAHEINNPINFIHGNLNPAKSYIQDLLDLIHRYQAAFPESTPEIQQQIEAIDLAFLEIDLLKLLNSIGVGTSRIQEIVQSLRIFSRLDEAEMKQVDIHEGIDSTLMIVKNRLKPKSNRGEILISKDYDNLPGIECYPSYLNQVFLNIINNSIDALDECEKLVCHYPRGSEEPTIRIKTELVDQQWVQISIADNGIGIPEAIQPQIFDPFFTTKAIGKGTGLGLSMSYQIITDKHGGYLFCCSTPGEGTTFTIRIPLRPIVSKL